MTDKYDYYELLGVPRSASLAEIRVAYRRLARQYHPDVNASADAEEHFKELNEAYEVLSNQQKRSLYDLYGHAGLSQGIKGSDVGVGQMLDELLQQYVRTSNSSRFSGKWAGSDLNMSVEISFEEAVRGTQVMISLERYEQCSTCYGTGLNRPVLCIRCEGSGKLGSTNTSESTIHACPYCQGLGQVIRGQCRICYGERRERMKMPLKINIPAGIIDRMRIKVDGEGDKGLGGGPAGDLYVEVRVRSHPYLRRDGLNIMLGLELNLAQVMLGDEIEIPTLYGRERLVVPPGTQDGQLIRLKGKGIPDIYQQQPSGDMIIKISAQSPAHLTQAQRKLIHSLFGHSSRGFTTHDHPSDSATADSPRTKSSKKMRAIDLHLRLSQQEQQINMELIIQNQAFHLPLATPPHQMAHFSTTLEQESQKIAEGLAQLIESTLADMANPPHSQREHAIFEQLLSKLQARGK